MHKDVLLLKVLVVFVTDLLMAVVGISISIIAILNPTNILLELKNKNKEKKKAVM
jgi:hypothetical protein